MAVALQRLPALPQVRARGVMAPDVPSPRVRAFERCGKGCQARDPLRLEGLQYPQEDRERE
eukprot:14531575-Alexandrium_andersonii.AAC.1